MKTNVLCRQDLFKHFITHFSYEEVPDNWDDMTDQECFAWLSETAWEPFEKHDGETIFGMVDDLTDSTLNFLIANEINVVV